MFVLVVNACVNVCASGKCMCENVCVNVCVNVRASSECMCEYVY